MSDVQEVQWFPGHMARARREIEASLKLVDIVIELTDARAPASSRNPILQSLLQRKPSMIILNKADMADPVQTEKWITYYAEKGKTALALDAKIGKGVQKVLPAVRQVLSSQIARWEAKGMGGKPIRMMIVGIPNVGKSSLINQLCRGGAGKAAVQDRPGVTRQNQWFTVGKGFELLDTPGVLWPKFDDKLAGEHLAFTGAVRDEILDTERLAARLLEKIHALYPGYIAARYKLDAAALTEADGYALLTAVARKRGMLLPGNETDTERAGIMVLDEFRAGKIGRVTFEHKD